MFPALTRRIFLGAAAAATAVRGRGASKVDDKPALLGGTPVRSEPFPSWPLIADNDERAWMDVLRTKNWYRRSGHYVEDFEKAWAERMGAKHCLATANGTSALLIAMNALEVGPKDEVIVPPYTFIATVNAVLLQHALPVFVDSDRETLQIDARKIEAAITPRTRCIMPVHLGGASADMDAIMALARKHKIPVVEDACQSHLAEWRGRKVSSIGDLGCFSFQASKNLNSGEGGALITNNDDLLARAEAFHNNGRGLGKAAGGFDYRTNGANLRMTEFQGALLLSQMERLESQAKSREQNAQYLTKLLGEIEGISPAKMYEGCTRNAYHLYMFRYDPAGFAGLPRERFLKAMSAEGISCSSGYTPLNKDPFLENTVQSRGFKAIYSAKELDDWRARNSCPENDKLCGEAVWITQSRFLAGKRDMEQIAEAVRKIQKHAERLIG